MFTLTLIMVIILNGLSVGVGTSATSIKDGHSYIKTPYLQRVDIAPEFQFYYDLFVFQSKKYKVKLDQVASLQIQVHTFSKSYLKGFRTVGDCHIAKGHARIRIDKDYWSQATHMQKITLIAHELGHCLLGQDHHPDPNHIMYYSTGSTEAYAQNPNKLWKQLFLRKGN